MGGRGAVAAGIAVWAGVLAGMRLGVAPACGLLVASAALARIAWNAPPRVGATAALLALALAGGARGAGHQAVLRGERDRLARAGAFHRVAGRVVEPPPREAGEPVAVLAVERARPALLRGTRLRLRLPRGSAAEWGDEVDAVVRAEVPRGPRNPGGFDARAFADAAGLAGTGRAFRAVARPVRLPGGWPRATVARWRRGIERRLDAGLSPAARELVVPLVVGDRSGLSSGMYADLRASGLIHLLALSGLHVVWLASIARGAVASLGGGVGPRALAAALCAVFYAGLAGPLPSLMRAAAHECLMAAATLRGRALDPLQALALSALGLLACAPGWACDLGFQLSYAATLGLATLGPWLGERAGRWRRACAPFIPTLSAQATALPLLLARFHAVSWVGTLANLLAVPVSGLLLAAAWLGVLAETVLPGSGGTVVLGRRGAGRGAAPHGRGRGARPRRARRRGQRGGRVVVRGAGRGAAGDRAAAAARARGAAAPRPASGAGRRACWARPSPRPRSPACGRRGRWRRRPAGPGWWRSTSARATRWRWPSDARGGCWTPGRARPATTRARARCCRSCAGRGCGGSSG